LDPIIRHETPADVDAIAEVTAAAFATLAVSQHTEQYVIRALREAGVLVLSLVAELDGRVVGHVAFSPVAIGDGTRGWYGLGPVSVLPEHQRRGIGRALIERGLALLRERGGQGCALVGDPGYYLRFGFRSVPGLVHEGVPPEAFLVLPFTERVPQGTVVFHEGFRATA
jgi:putative acetyltransferase